MATIDDVLEPGEARWEFRAYHGDALFVTESVNRRLEETIDRQAVDRFGVPIVRVTVSADADGGAVAGVLSYLHPDEGRSDER